MQIFTALLISLIFCGLAPPQGAAQNAIAVSEIVSGTRCAAKVREWLGEQEAGSAAIKQPGSAPGVTAYNIPTADFGRRLALQADGGGELRAARVTAAGVLRIRWGAGCRPSEEETPGPFDAESLRVGFTDTDLSAKLAAGKRGVIYLWSPHMLFSVEGIEGITAAAKSRGLELVVVLDPRADRKFAAAALATEAARTDANAQAGKAVAGDAAQGSSTQPIAQESALRPLASVELLFRGLTNHAPSIQLYGNGNLIGPMLPGVRSVEGYLEFFDSFAQALAK